ncbi:DNA/RNA non-specific endonuclease [Prevotella sp. oral taxon 317]|jgi:DNA/RNA non-specific endonuclease|uniref:DNA/RNA non-specific endonuclease n=1 Tax=Prevotella sp. oral taxon 317 TaxID=652721 RepID=UPI0005C687DC|nr:DNA/RNA non-specific endonuclease [Prevotella sp. oral taxon 317]
MKSRKVYSLALLAGICLSACGLQPSKLGRQLGGKYAYQEQKDGQINSEGKNGYATDKQGKAAYKVADGLEVPEKLTDRPEQILKRVAYTASYNSDLRIPNWVAWRLTGAHTRGKNKRAGVKFHEDTDVPMPRAVDFDYVRSGYDRGHLCPSADNRWDATAQEQSFLLTNVCPQDHNLNVGDWHELEILCRKWAKTYGSIYIVAGPVLFKGKHKTIGKNKVTVPEAFFKVVLCMEGTPKAIGFIYRNESGNRPKSYYVNTIDDVERITGIDFFPALPDKVENEVEATSSLDDW